MPPNPDTLIRPATESLIASALLADPWPQWNRTRPDHLANALGGLRGVSLTELDQAQLHDRDESKVILRVADVPAALERLADEYAVLQHEGHRVQSYRNDYFDNPELRNYHEHHNQNGRRLKLRYRSYLSSELTFEVKQNVSGRTVT